MSRTPITDDYVFHYIHTELGCFEAYDNGGDGECLAVMPKKMKRSGVWAANLDDAKDVAELIRKMHRKKDIKTTTFAKWWRVVSYKVEKWRTK